MMYSVSASMAWATSSRRSRKINPKKIPETDAIFEQFSLVHGEAEGDETVLRIQLAYYPPYHSKYNPIERVWGGLEQHWNGALLDSVDTVLNFAHSFTWRTRQPVVALIDRIYETGVSLSQKAMTQLEERFDRFGGLEKWFVTISPIPA